MHFHLFVNILHINGIGGEKMKKILSSLGIVSLLTFTLVAPAFASTVKPFCVGPPTCPVELEM